MEFPELRSLVLRHSGFDLMRSSQFAEAYVCHIIGAKQTVNNNRVDGILEGVRVEVKHAVAFDAKSEAGTRRRLCFRYLQGGNPAGKEADVYVLVGYDEDVFHYLVIPAIRLGKRRDLDVFLFGMTGKQTSMWLPYFVPESNLGDAVVKAARHPETYRGWNSPGLF